MRFRWSISAVALVAISAALGWLIASGRLAGLAAQEKNPQPAQTGDRQLPKPDPEFKGEIGKTLEDSKASYPQQVKAPKGSPNVLIILLDDVGRRETEANIVPPWPGAVRGRPRLDHRDRPGLQEQGQVRVHGEDREGRV
jgi:hypothetical protein